MHGRALFVLPYFAATYFNMKVNKSPRYEESKQMRQNTCRQKLGVKQSANHYSAEGVTIVSM